MFGKYLISCGIGCPFFIVSEDDRFAYCSKFGNSIVMDGDTCIAVADDEDEEY